MARDYMPDMSFAEAMRDVGSTPGERVAWLGDFVARDLGSDDARERASNQLRAFLFGYATDIQHYGVLIQGNPTPESIAEAQAEIKAFLAIIETPATIHGIVAAATSTVISRRRLPPSDSVVAAVTAVSALLLSVGARLGRCETPSCGRLFAGSKTSQKRCRTNCGGTERVRAWREQNADRDRESSHRSYVKKVRASAPKAKVARRPRRRKES